MSDQPEDEDLREIQNGIDAERERRQRARGAPAPFIRNLLAVADARARGFRQLHLEPKAGPELAHLRRLDWQLAAARSRVAELEAENASLRQRLDEQRRERL